MIISKCPALSAIGRKPTLIPLNFPCNAYQLEATINVLERKGILTAKEVLDELEVIVARGNPDGFAPPYSFKKSPLPRIIFSRKV